MESESSRRYSEAITLDYLKKLEQWISESESSGNEPPRIVSFLHEIGVVHVIWLILTRDEIYVKDVSDELDQKLVSSFTNPKNYEKIKDWIINQIQDESIRLQQDQFEGILLSLISKPGEISVVLGEMSSTSLPVKKVRYLTKIALLTLERDEKIRTLQNSIKLAYSGYSTDLEITGSESAEVEEDFIESVVPAIFYSIFHESFGPLIIESIPKGMQAPENQLIAVKLYSGLDADMVSDLGHVLSTIPVRNPVLGEFLSIFFTIPNPKARGKFEIHAISLHIPHEFVNMSKSMINHLKTYLFNGVEQLRQEIDMKQSTLATTALNKIQSEEIGIKTVLNSIRVNVASSYSLFISTTDEYNI